jgi:Myb-like DNA-binding domain
MGGECRITHNMPLHQALVQEYNDDGSPILQPHNLTILLTNLSISVAAKREINSVAAPYVPADLHLRLPSDYPVAPAALTIDDGRNKLALFGDDTVPRLVDKTLVAIHANRSKQALDARLSLQEVCYAHAKILAGPILRIFMHEGWTPEKMWECIPAEHRQGTSSLDACPWAWLDAAFEAELDVMIQDETEEDEMAEEARMTETQPEGRQDIGSLGPQTGADSPERMTRRIADVPRRCARWTPDEDMHMRLCREAGISWNEIGASLGRTRVACHNRYYHCKFGKDAAVPTSTSDQNGALELPIRSRTAVDVQVDQLGGPGGASAEETPKHSTLANYGAKWTSNEDSKLVSLREQEGLSWQQISEQLERTVFGVRQRHVKLQQIKAAFNSSGKPEVYVGSGASMEDPMEID